MPRDLRAKPELHRLLELLSPVDRRVMAQLWAAPSAAPEALLDVMRDSQRVRNIWERLMPSEQAALTRVLQEQGALPVAVMHREYGAVREPGGFEHPRAYLQALQGPATATERLYNLGLIFRSHDERGAIYRIPNDLLPLLPAVPPRDRRLRLHAAAEPGLRNRSAAGLRELEDLLVVLLTLANAGQLKALEDGALNKASLVRVAKQLGDHIDVGAIRREQDWPFVALARVMLVEAGLLRRTVGSATLGSAARGEGDLRPTAQSIDWLRAPQGERVRRLLNGWCGSTSDDLTLLCGLRWKGGASYTLNRTATRRNLLALLATLPEGDWVSLHEIIGEIYRVEPDFQRRDGRYDTWLLYNSADQLVSGWADWKLVEGRLIAEVLCGPLQWLGLVEVGHGTDDQPVTVRLTPLGTHILADGPAPPEPPATPLVVQSTFEVLCPLSASMYAKFQLGRVAEPRQRGPLATYVLTRPALLEAIQRGISASDVLRFLQEHSGDAVPPAVAYTLLEWGGQAEQIRLEHAVLLHAADPVVLAQVRAARVLDLADAEQLSPTVLRVPHGAADELAERLRRAGFGLRDDRIDPQHPLDERDIKAVVLAAFAYVRTCTELDLPCELTPAALQRLADLVPPRWADAARQAATAFVKQIEDRAGPQADDK